MSSSKSSDFLLVATERARRELAEKMKVFQEQREMLRGKKDQGFKDAMSAIGPKVQTLVRDANAQLSEIAEGPFVVDNNSYGTPVSFDDKYLLVRIKGPSGTVTVRSPLVLFPKSILTTIKRSNDAAADHEKINSLISRIRHEVDGNLSRAIRLQMAEARLSEQDTNIDSIVASFVKSIAGA